MKRTGMVGKGARSNVYGRDALTTSDSRKICHDYFVSSF